MTPPAAPERCPTCDREGCQRADLEDPARHSAIGAMIALDCGREWINGVGDCLRHAVNHWRARAIAAEAAAAQWAKVAPLIERLDRAAMVGASHAELLDAVADVCAVRRPTIDEATP